MKARWLNSLRGLVPLTLALLFLGLCISRGETNRQIKDECGVQSTRVDRTRDGPVDCKVFFCVTNTIAGASVAVECDHRSLGVPDWLICIRSTNGNGGGNADRRLIAGAILLVVDSLHRKYAADPVGGVYLEPANMPGDFSATFYKIVAEQMRKLDSRAKRFDDPRVRAMVKDAYRQMEYVQYIKSRLEEDGFAVKVDTAELCCLKRSVEGMAWKDIANEPAVGLNVESATCCLGLERNSARR